MLACTALVAVWAKKLKATFKMLAQTLITLLDATGIVVFAASGALAAARKSMDIFGFAVISVITAVGGGTVRDLILGISPVTWVANNLYIILALITACVVYVAESRISSRLRLLTWLDAMGLALFASLGAQTALQLETSGLIAVMMGIITAVFGGMIRDIICNEIPLILQQEIYATAAFGAAIAVVAASTAGLDPLLAIALGTISGFTIRALAIVYGWSLPTPASRS